MQAARSNTNDTVHALARRISRYEELLKLLSSLGGTVRQAGEREGDDDVDAVRRSSQALTAVLSPHEFAFYISQHEGEVEAFSRMIPTKSRQFPETIREPEQGAKERLQAIPLSGKVVGLAYWHLPEKARRWALVIRPTRTGYVEPSASFGIKLFGDFLAGRSSARIAAEAPARQRALQDAVLRLVDEQKVVLSVEVERLRRTGKDMFDKLEQLEQLLERPAIDRSACARVVENMREARMLFTHATVQLAGSVRGMSPRFLDIRGQLEEEQDVPIAHVVGEIPGDERGGDVPSAVWIRTQPRVLTRSIEYLQGILRKLIIDVSLLDESSADVDVPNLRVSVVGDSAVFVDIVFQTPPLDAAFRQELSGLLTRVISAESWAVGDVSLAYPLAWRSVLDYLKSRLGIDVTLIDDDSDIGFRLRIPTEQKEGDPVGSASPGKQIG